MMIMMMIKWFAVQLIDNSFSFLCRALRDLVLFVQFKKRDKQPCKSITFNIKLQGEACKFTKINTPAWLFSRFLSRANGTKLHKASYIMPDVSCISKSNIRPAAFKPEPNLGLLYHDATDPSFIWLFKFWNLHLDVFCYVFGFLLLISNQKYQQHV